MPAQAPLCSSHGAFTHGASTRSAFAQSRTAAERVQAQRGKWSSIDGVTVFGWSGSALVGGSILDHHGFAVVFLLTAALQLFACVAFAGPLLFMIPLFEASCECECECGSEGGTNGQAGLQQGSEASDAVDGVTAAAVAAAAPARQQRCSCCGCCISASTAGDAVGASQPCCKHCQHGSRRWRSSSVDSAVEALARSADDELGVLAPQPVPQAVDARSSHDSARRRSGAG